MKFNEYQQLCERTANRETSAHTLCLMGMRFLITNLRR